MICTLHRCRASLRRAATSLCLAAACLVPAAQAGVLDALLGKGNAEGTAPDQRRRLWQVSDWTSVRLVAREADAPPNEHPRAIDPDRLRQVLAQVRLDSGGAGEPLFAADELADLVEPLVAAFALARPDDDVLLLSTSRRGGGIFVPPRAVTARLFVSESALQLVVADARFEFYNEYLGSRRPPEFSFGTRARAGRAVLRTAAGSVRRPDWVALQLAETGAAPESPAPKAAGSIAPPAAKPAAQPQAVAPAAPSAAATPAPAAAPRVRDAAFAEEIEQRLTTLKRLRDRGLISEDEYQQKRREVLALL